MTDGPIAMAAYAVLAVFLGILIWYVPRIDLTAIILITLALVARDFFFPSKQARRR